MAEQTFPLEIVGVDYVCDACGIGTMRPHGEIAYMTHPVQFPHKCNHCGATATFAERYPTVRHRRREQSWPLNAMLTPPHPPTKTNNNAWTASALF